MVVALSPVWWLPYPLYGGCPIPCMVVAISPVWWLPYPLYSGCPIPCMVVALSPVWWLPYPLYGGCPIPCMVVALSPVWWLPYPLYGGCHIPCMVENNQLLGCGHSLDEDDIRVDNSCPFSSIQTSGLPSLHPQYDSNGLTDDLHH